jgi:hypothetical protein
MTMQNVPQEQGVTILGLLADLQLALWYGMGWYGMVWCGVVWDGRVCGEGKLECAEREG